MRNLLANRGTHIRTRLTLWHVAVVALVVLLYSAGASAMLLRGMRRQLVRYSIQDIETIEGLLSFAPNGKLQLREDYHNHAESKEVLERLVEVRATDGTVLYRNDRLGNRTLGGPLLPNEGVGGYSERRQTLEDGAEVLVVSRQHNLEGRPTVIRLAHSEAPLTAQFRDELLALLLPLPFVLLLAGAGGYFLADRALRPIQRMAQRAETITSERLHERLPVREGDGELADLARVFNTMLARIEQSFEQLKRFTSDASHELRTPLTAMRSVGEVALQQKASADSYRDVIGSMLEEANSLTRLVDTLLAIARTDEGRVVFQKTTFRAMDLARECRPIFEILIDEKQQQLICEGDESAVVTGDWLLLRQALLNIVHNAVKYSPAGSIVRVRVTKDADSVCFAVEDDGPGIEAEHTEHVFDRFYRADHARSRETGGVGLGLSIAQRILEAHGGRMTLDSVAGRGSIFAMHLPTGS